MVAIDIQRFVMYDIKNGNTIEYFPTENAKDLVHEYIYGNPPMVIVLDNLVCIRKCSSDDFLCMEISGEMPRQKLESCDWFYKGKSVELQDDYGYIESYLQDLKISQNPFWQGYLSTR